jgi:hypothetical protein
MLGLCATVVKPYLLYHERRAIRLVSRELCALRKGPICIWDSTNHDKIKKAAVNHSNGVTGTPVSGGVK